MFVCAQAGCVYRVIQPPGIGGIDDADLEQEGRIGQIWKCTRNTLDKSELLF